MLLVGPGSSIQEGSLDHKVVSLGVGLRFSKGNLGKESLVPAADIITFGPSYSSIFHMLGPSGVAHVDMPAPLSKVGNHALQVSIGSQEIQYLLLPFQVVGVIGIQIHIEITHKDRSVSIGRALIESSLNMSMEVIRSLLAWK